MEIGTDSTSAPKAQDDNSFTLILVDLVEDLITNFRVYFADLPNVQYVVGRFELLPQYDCMVSAANSFGLMDGGVDAAITKYFGKQLESRVQQFIIDKFDGEQPIGTSFVIDTRDPQHPWLAHTPTMRVPYSVLHTDYVYLAMKAMLRAVKDHNLQAVPERKIRSVACTGLGTFYGRMPYHEAARQMALAYRNFLHPPSQITWGYAGQRQQAVIFGGYQGLQASVPASLLPPSEKSTSKDTDMEGPDFDEDDEDGTFEAYTRPCPS